jgi:hypothetical protein
MAFMMGLQWGQTGENNGFGRKSIHCRAPENTRRRNEKPAATGEIVVNTLPAIDPQAIESLSTKPER